MLVGDDTVVSSNSCYAIYNTGEKAKVEITEGTLSSETFPVLCNEGDATIRGGTLVSPISGNAIYNKGEKAKVEITGGTLSSEAAITLYNEGNATISGNTVVSSSSMIAIQNVKGATVNISENAQIKNNGYIEGSTSTYAAIKNDGTANVLGGTIYSKSSHAIYNQSGATLNVSGGTITSEGGNGWRGVYNNGTANITGGTISSRYGC